MTPNTGDASRPAETDGGGQSANAAPTSDGGGQSANAAPTSDGGGQSSPNADGSTDSATDTPGAEPAPTAASATVPGNTALTKHKPPEQEAFDWRGWLLVGVVVLAFLVVPAIVLFLPQLHGVLSYAGLSLTQTYLIFPMIPALLLGGIAVWAAVRSRTAE
ncbi:MAG: hypothetical protein V5A55_08835 [Halovenus sp.]